MLNKCFSSVQNWRFTVNFWNYFPDGSDQNIKLRQIIPLSTQSVQIDICSNNFLRHELGHLTQINSPTNIITT